MFNKSNDGCHIFVNKLEEVNKLIPAKIYEMKDVYGIIMTDDEAIACLRHFHWNDTRLSERWFED